MIGTRWAIAGALVGFAAGFAGLASTALGTACAGAGSLLPWLVLAGLGAGMVMTLGADAIMSSVRAERAGAAGAIQETSFELGAGLGIAMLGTALAVTYRATLPPFPGLSPAVNARLHDSLGVATELAPRLGERARPVLDAAQRAFTHGFAAASLVAAAALSITAVLGAFFLRHRGSQ